MLRNWALYCAHKNRAKRERERKREEWGRGWQRGLREEASSSNNNNNTHRHQEHIQSLTHTHMVSKFTIWYTLYTRCAHANDFHERTLFSSRTVDTERHSVSRYKRVRTSHTQFVLSCSHSLSVDFAHNGRIILAHTCMHTHTAVELSLRCLMIIVHFA